MRNTVVVVAVVVLVLAVSKGGGAAHFLTVHAVIILVILITGVPSLGALTIALLRAAERRTVCLPPAPAPRQLMPRPCEPLEIPEAFTRPDPLTAEDSRVAAEQAADSGCDQCLGNLGDPWELEVLEEGKDLVTKQFCSRKCVEDYKAADMLERRDQSARR
jgi:hypothetical protein